MKIFISFVFLAFLHPGVVMAASSDYLLKLDGVKGETTKAPVVETTTTLAPPAPPSPITAPTNTVTNPMYQDKGVAGTNPLYEPEKAKIAPPPPRPPAGDPDFDLLKVAPPPPPRPPMGDPDFDLLKTAPSSQGGKVNVAAGDVNGDGSTSAKKGNVEYEWKVEEGESAQPGGDPDFDLLNIHFDEDEDDDGDNVPSKDENVSGQKKVNVRGWDPKKKEEVIAHPELVRTADDLRAYTEVTTLESDEITGVQMDKSSVEIESTEEGKLLWFIPVTMRSHVMVDLASDTTDDPVSVKLPWWSVFVKKSVDPSDTEGAIRAELALKPWEKVDNTESPVLFGRISHTLRSVSNVLKTRHDTAKNSIGNIR